MAIQRVHSKWAKTNALLKSDFFNRYIPDTKPFSINTVNSMLQQYSMVYIKPDKGTFGLGVIRVERTRTGYRLRYNSKSASYNQFNQLYQALRRLIRNRGYLVQKGIHLLRYNKRRFDLRVMVQKNDQQAWETTGIIGRLSHPSKIVTNYHSGGTPLPIERLMSPHMNATELAAFASHLRKLGVSVAEQLQKKYPGLKELGIDVAVDDKNHPWILEVNTLPDPFIFRKLPDQAVFRKIYRYACGYGRYKQH